MRKGEVGEAARIVFAAVTQAARALGRAAAFCVGLTAMVTLVAVLATLVAVMVVAAVVPALVASAAHDPKKRIHLQESAYLGDALAPGVRYAGVRRKGCDGGRSSTER